MSKDISIVLSGEAGQGIKTIEKLVVKALRDSGYNFFSTSEVMSRVRGGNNTTEVRISNKKVSAFVDKIDYLIIMSKNAIYRLEDRIKEETLIIGESDFIEDKFKKKYKVKSIPINEIAKKAGSKIVTNVVIFGIILGILSIDKNKEKERIKMIFSEKGEKIIKMNLKALESGYSEGENFEVDIDIPADKKVKDCVLLNGTEAIGFGALAGGCNFISSYPMSPSTGVITFMADNSEEFGVVVEQAEDEISAMNMNLGAWYAGARAMVTTSGGGLALMQEGISLAAMTEVPAVIHLAQRPGPATGLPTRTEQGDLNFAIYSGHGEFPKLMFAPGNLKDGIELTQKAFNLADKYRITVIIMTDQYFLDSYSLLEKINFSKFKNDINFKKRDKNHKTYEFTKTGVSPRAIPGYGDGLECVDSDEHDEKGRITEDFKTRVKMVNKRLKKLDFMKEDYIEPEIIGSKDYKALVVGWGSTYGVIKEALEELNSENTAFAYFKQVYPLPEKTKEILKKAKTVVVVENNATAQFANLIKLETGIKADKNILQYNGMPFSVETLKKELGGLK